jgi:hypothetical protein
MIKIGCHTDAGHGWYSVKRHILEEFVDLSDISSFSYQRGKTVYLEEDSDAPKLIEQLKKQQIEFEIKWYKQRDTSPIRSYDSFTN